MTATVLAGASASPGQAAGAVRLLGAAAGAEGELAAADVDRAVAEGRAALETAAQELAALAAAASGEEAEILETSVLMARDPALMAAVEEEVRVRRRPAAAALLAAADALASTLAALEDEMLAARADDVRSIGRRAARIVTAGDAAAGPSAAGAVAPGAGAVPVAGAGEAGTVARGGAPPVVLVASDLGPADVAELGPDVCAVALAHGAVTAHAAIVARARGLPMLVATGAAALSAEPGSQVVVDAHAGRLLLDPSDAELEAARAAMSEREAERSRALAERRLPAVTRDGRRLLVLTNAAGPEEVRAGLEAGAEGAGLIRTELAFLDAAGWPSEADHYRALEPVLAALRGRIATVRVLDFGGDKTPPFLDGTADRGLRLLLAAPRPFADQVRAILHAASGSDLRILLPMVGGSVELVAARDLIARVAAGEGQSPPRIGAMIETPRAAGVAFQIASGADFLSIGTNDLTHATLGSDRFSAAEAATHHPKVLRSIDRSVRAARSSGIPIEVCGEAASDPAVLPLLVGLGVDELSVGAARVGATRAWVRALDRETCARVAAQALAARSAAEVAALVAPLRPDRGAVAAGA